MDLSRHITTKTRRGFGYITAILSTIMAAVCTTYVIFCVSAAIAILALHTLSLVGLVSPATLISSSTFLANISSASFLRGIIQSSMTVTSVQERIKLLGLVSVTLINGFSASHFLGLTKKAFRFGFSLGEIAGMFIGNVSYGVIKAAVTVSNGIAHDVKESSIGVLKGIREVSIGLAKGAFKLVSSVANAVIILGTSLVDFIRDLSDYSTDSIPNLDPLSSVNTKPHNGGGGGGFGSFGIHNQNSVYVENRINVFLPSNTLREEENVPYAVPAIPTVLGVLVSETDAQDNNNQTPEDYSDPNGRYLF